MVSNQLRVHMNRWLKRITLISSSAILLSGCSIFSTEEDVVTMAELPEFTATYQPQIAWKSSVGDGVDKHR